MVFIFEIRSAWWVTTSENFKRHYLVYEAIEIKVIFHLLFLVYIPLYGSPVFIRNWLKLQIQNFQGRHARNFKGNNSRQFHSIYAKKWGQKIGQKLSFYLTRCLYLDQSFTRLYISYIGHFKLLPQGP